MKRNEIDKRNENGEDLLPNCDLSVWLRSCDEEVIEPIIGQKTGQIPKWLNGSLLRNGPGSLGVGESKFQHLFDGSSLIHRFGIRDGEVTYQCRFLQTNTLKKNQAAKRIVISEFGTEGVPDPCHTIFDKLSAFFHPQEVSDNCMISIYPFADELYTFSEYPVIHRIDPMTIETLKTVDVSNYVSIVHHTSHPHIMVDGTVYNLGLTVTPTGPKYAIVEFPFTREGEKKPGGDVFGEATVVASVATRWPLHPGYMHTFGVTDNYWVIVEQPMSVSVAAVLATKFTNKATSSNLRWFPEYNTLILIVSKRTGSLVATYYCEPFFYLHIINQYEEEGYVVLDICVYKDPSMIHCMYIDALKVSPDELYS
ncbi:hypothetical protein AAG570_002108 [Ranatra chinensis]|uniref:Beta,beta-carotene 15,15'-dioxygenase n=1 Tax=Ranatra chinensis TaxID=642074 RepID=A0ABD0Y6J4_9HEMI